MIIDQLHIILGSGSPRRKQLIDALGFNYTQIVYPINEEIPKDLSPEKVAEYLSREKSKAFNPNDLKKNEVVLTADTVVIASNKILGKPKDYEEAYAMIKSLSGKKHEVITGVTLKSQEKISSFSSTTKVQFKELDKDEINYYITTFKPYDKAAAYGIQEWIGQIGIEKVEGCFYNVMGLPTSLIWSNLKNDFSSFN